MYTQSAEYYDLIYGEFKDYPREVQQVAEMIRTHNPGTRAILDMACGTGNHAKLLHQYFGFAVDGVDLDPNMVRIAARKHPGGHFRCADMSDDPGEGRYDAVLCLFSSIGYLKTLARVTAALDCFSSHLRPGGITIVEPWFTPETAQPLYFDMQTVSKSDLKICRMGYTVSRKRMSRVKFQYLINSREGIRHKSEIHELGLFTIEELKHCFQEAGFAILYDPQGFNNRGIYIGKRER